MSGDRPRSTLYWEFVDELENAKVPNVIPMLCVGDTIPQAFLPQPGRSEFVLKVRYQMAAGHSVVDEHRIKAELGNGGILLKGASLKTRTFHVGNIQEPPYSIIVE